MSLALRLKKKERKFVLTVLGQALNNLVLRRVDAGGCVYSRAAADC